MVGQFGGCAGWDYAGRMGHNPKDLFGVERLTTTQYEDGAFLTKAIDRMNAARIHQEERMKERLRKIGRANVRLGQKGSEEQIYEVDDEAD